MALYFALTVSIDHWHVIEFNLMKYFSQYVVALRKFLTMWIFMFALLSRRVSEQNRAEIIRVKPFKIDDDVRF